MEINFQGNIGHEIKYNTGDCFCSGKKAQTIIHIITEVKRAGQFPFVLSNILCADRTIQAYQTHFDSKQKLLYYSCTI